MANYDRQHTFQTGEKPAAADIEAEFNAIQAVINGNLEQSNFPAGEIGEGLLVHHAADSQFSPLGTESNASRVRNAIDAAKLVGSHAKVVWVPKSMWGYVADADYTNTMYDNSVLLVREGALAPWYDPIAYGAKADGVQDDHEAMQAAIDAAVAATGPGIKVLAFTVPGTYKNETQVDLNVGVGWMTFPGVTFSGASGHPRGAAAWLFPIALIHTGPRAQATNPGATPGEAFFAADTKEFLVGDGTEWTAVGVAPMFCKARLSADQGGAAGGATHTVVFNEVISDVEGLLNPATGAFRLPQGWSAGYFEFVVCLQVLLADDGGLTNVEIAPQIAKDDGMGGFQTLDSDHPYLTKDNSSLRYRSTFVVLLEPDTDYFVRVFIDIAVITDATIEGGTVNDGEWEKSTVAVRRVT